MERKNNRKIDKKICRNLLLMILVVFMISSSIYSGVHMVMAAKYRQDSNKGSAGTYDAKVPSDTKEKDADCFTILEIVPYEGMGEIGYMVGGCEPIDLTKLKTREYDGFTSFLGKMLLVRDTYIEKATLTKEEQEMYADWKKVYVAKQEKGTFHQVTPNTGEYSFKTVVEYVVDEKKQGAYTASLNQLNFSKQINGIRQKENNVNAWFYPDSKKESYTPFSQEKYTVCNASKNEEGKGDYEYDRLADEFVLCKGKGTYDVLFMPYTGQRDQKIYYMEKNYEIVNNHTGSYTGEIVYKNALDIDRDGIADGQYNKVSRERYEFVGEGMGEYLFKKGEGEISYPIYEKCYYRSGVEYINTEWFKQYAMGLSVDEWDECKIEVITCTPEKVNDDLTLIEKADMVFLSPTQQNLAYVGLWEFFGKEKELLGITDENRYTVSDLSENGLPANLAGLRKGRKLPTFIGNDLNWEATMAIFQRVGVKQDLPLVINCLVYENNQQELNGYNNSTRNNIAKLYLMLRQWNPQIFYEEFFETNQILKATFQGITTGDYIKKSENARYIWHSQTFLPTVPNGVQDPYAYYVSMGIENPYMVGNESVVGNVFTFHGDCIIDANFIVDKYGPDEWFYETKEFIYQEENEKEGSPEEVTNVRLSTADIFYYLLHYKKVSLEKNKLVILDLEPCNDFTLTETDVRNMVKGFTGTITIVPMTTAEFNGKIEDLNKEYDMIYMGLNTGMLNRNAKGITKYNDSNLNGKIYLHVGDRIYGGNALSGLVQGVNTYRYSGNDITAIKKKELEEFIKAGYPIVMEKELYERNAEQVDPYSNIYAFSESCKEQKNRINLYSLQNAQTKSKACSQLKKYLAIEKPQLEFDSMPVMYDGNHPDVLMTEKRLSYVFTIQDLKAEEMEKLTYTVKLYVDGNADGKYAENELLATKTGIKAGSSIELMKTLPNSYVGIVPWKLLVYRTDNPYIRTNQIGYYGIRRSSTEKKLLRILQVTSTKYSRYNWTGSTMNLQNELASKNTLFHKYASNLNDFVLDITTIDVKQFENWYKGSAYGVSNAYVADDPNSIDRFANYDMLIFGFGDSYTDISNANGALDNVFAFIESGKSVLFTHDTTSVVNRLSNSDTHTAGVMNWGYNMNQYLRDRIGMNRFGVATKGQESQGNNTEGKDIAYSPKGSIYKEIQGYSYGAMINFGVVAGDRYSSIPTNQLGPFRTFLLSDSRYLDFPSTDSFETYYVTNENKGQITEYPYKIPTSGKMQIAQTHAQYYELDLEDPEIVVWYCLSNQMENKLYSSSPNDVRNNYYIYNKGNITYTGAGHEYFGNKENEVKLFINTMVAAYRASLAEPEITVTNGVEGQDGKSFVYVDLDVRDNMLPSNESDEVKVAFTVKDDSIISDSAKITIYDENGEVMNLAIYDEYNQVILDSKVYTYSKNTQGELYEYYILYPREKLDGKESINLMIMADNTKIKARKTVTLLRRNLFDLN
ncbi:DUF5057 domain-containing protein [Anaerosporobacter faecicola]|uniref:DUF5057 domain-containing protein n=1 Tax=Anaerosporobacter faecicola TaxID=2718714 RepID=UPI00143BC616|nr:DUF5057 domain-containing protein [Anaerosporobacter faecicola]